MMLRKILPLPNTCLKYWKCSVIRDKCSLLHDFVNLMVRLLFHFRLNFQELSVITAAL